MVLTVKPPSSEVSFLREWYPHRVFSKLHPCRGQAKISFIFIYLVKFVCMNKKTRGGGGGWGIMEKLRKLVTRTISG
jgi:hypothetical protein